MSPTCIQLNFFRRATRALLHAASDGIVLKNRGYLSFFVRVGDVDPYDTCVRNTQLEKKLFLKAIINIRLILFLKDHFKCNMAWKEI